MSLKKRSSGSASSCGDVPLESAGSWGKKFPQLFEFLSQSRYEDGSTRECGKFTVMVQGGCWKVCLNDLDLKQYCFVSGQTLDDALKAADRAVNDSDADWRASVPFPKVKAKKD